ncbi:hypothetical protein L2E82_04320 [Cichorium intybus]|uniref:Uncharacterized protein n=1 Tax=Cichorium intybus TaxID=13427 RepID=A0ACB9H7H0_CICIN|nr:hypothetical protein L2E82_04320 [Cichorium intybus]
MDTTHVFCKDLCLRKSSQEFSPLSRIPTTWRVTTQPLDVGESPRKDPTVWLSLPAAVPQTYILPHPILLLLNPITLIRNQALPPLPASPIKFFPPMKTGILLRNNHLQKVTQNPT